MNHNIQKALHYCIWLLSRQEYSEKQIAEKLQKKVYEQDVIDKVITLLKQNKYLSNTRFTQQKMVVLSQKYGLKRTMQTLKQAGIQTEDILHTQEQLLEQQQIDEEHNVAFEVWKKRFGYMTFAELNEPKMKQKQWSYLMYRGFDGQLLDRFLKQQKEFEE
jgi:regulatory protein